MTWMDPYQFERICSMSLVADKLKEFLVSNNAFKEYQNIHKKFRRDLMTDCINLWLNHVPDRDKAFCFDLLLKYWRTEEIVTCLAENTNVSKYNLAKKLQDAESLKYDHHPVKTIATYYHAVFNGGVERVIASLIPLWIKMGYKVILLTDFPADENDYEIPPDVERIIIPDHQTIKRNNYGLRAEAVAKILRDFKVDVVIGHAWLLDIMFWDQLIIKMMGAAHILHCHGVFSYCIYNTWYSERESVAPYYLADAVVTLSEADQQFWSYFNHNVHKVINPFFEDISKWPVSTCEGQDILWVGRLSEEKQPYDLLDIIQEVRKSSPDIKLHIVGKSKDEQYFHAFQKEITNRDLKNNIVLHGFQKDVKPYYKKASMFLLTSRYEGYCLALQEALMSGLPIVAYELPYLTLMQGNEGVLAVSQGDVVEAAKRLTFLINNEGKRKDHGRKAREFIEEAAQFDFQGKWKKIFESLFHEHEAGKAEQELLMMETLITHHDIGVNQLKEKTRYNGRKTVRAAVLFVKGKDSLSINGKIETLKKVAKKLKGCLYRER